MNNVPNDILSITKVLRRIISHTIHWSHKNQASQALKHGRTSEVLPLFQGHVSYVSWVCCIVLLTMFHSSVLHMLHLSVAHYSFHKTNTHEIWQYVAMLHKHVSCNISSWMDEWCSCLWNASANVEAKHLGCYNVLLKSLKPLQPCRWRDGDRSSTLYPSVVVNLTLLFMRTTHFGPQDIFRWLSFFYEGRCN